jgi:hypothetical protein
MGWVIDAQGGRAALVIGGLTGLVCAAFVAVRLRKR